MIQEEITTGQIYRIQVNFEDLRDSYVKILRVNDDTVNLIRTKDKDMSFHVVPLWVIENSKYIFVAKQEALTEPKTIWQKIMKAIKS